MARRKRTDKVVEDTGCTEAEYEHMFEEESMKTYMDVEGEIRKLYGPLGQGNVTGILHAILSELVRARLERRNHV